MRHDRRSWDIRGMRLLRLVRVLAVAVVVLVLLALVNAFFTDRATKSAHADGGQIVHLPGGDVQVREDGDRAGAPVVLIHGWASSMHWWDRLVPLLGRFRVVRVDLLGHGGSAKPRGGYSMAAQADRVARALEVLRLGKPATVVGHSTGGEVAIALAARHPGLVGRLVVIDTETDEDDVHVDTSTKLTVTPVIGEALWRFLTDGQIRDGLHRAFSSDRFPVPDQFVHDVKRLTFSSYKKTYDESADYVDDGDLARDFRRTRVPAMIVFGGRDRLVEPRSARGYAALRPVRTAIVPGAGHAVMVERPDAVARLLTAFARAPGASSRGRRGHPAAAR
jgi:pimeloyl-ACP methyl ester carboxylesterase